MLNWLIDRYESLLVFFETGGDVLIAIFFVTFVMWVMIIERMLYLKLLFPKEAAEALGQWQSRTDKSSWHAKQIRRELISVIKQKLTQSLPMIKAFIALCPLLGLLGTVTGMIEVFDVMAIAGSGNPRAMASGVSRATVPTMAGMVAALSGLYFGARLTRVAEKESRRFEDQLG